MHKGRYRSARKHGMPVAMFCHTCFVKQIFGGTEKKNQNIPYKKISANYNQ
jgi:hypothetical protein